MHVATLQCARAHTHTASHTHTQTHTTRAAHILGLMKPWEVVHLKNISPPAWLFIWLFVHEVMHCIDAIHSGHLQTKHLPRSFAPFVFLLLLCIPIFTSAHHHSQ